MKINETHLALGLICVLLFAIGSRHGKIIEGLGHKSTAIRRDGVKVTRAAILQLAPSTQHGISPLGLYDSGICTAQLVHRGKRSMKLCKCGAFGFKNANAFPGRKCSATDPIML